MVGGVLKHAATTAVDEAAKMLGVRQDVWYIIGELEMMQAFLVAAETRRDNNNVMLIWVRQVRDLAYQIEDCLLEFSLHLKNRSLCYRLRTLPTRRRIASHIRDIREKVKEVSQRNLRYNLIKPMDSSFDANNLIKDRNFTTCVDEFVVEETELVGQTESKNKLIEMITKKDMHLKVIWITGMGGLGKTTLARKVIDSREVGNKFPSPVWFTVSQNFNPKDLLREIQKKLRKDKEEISNEYGELFQSVRSLLEKNNYLIVLDDLWTIETWNAVQKIILDNGKGSRVIVTTRNTNVAEHCNWNSKEIYPVEHLSPESSRNLLLRKIYKTDDFSKRNGDLDDVTDKIIKKCGGLPLAIVTVGGLLKNKPIDREEWVKLLGHLGSELETSPTTDAVKQILELSYRDLPYYLKPCLLSLSNFPEDFEIRRIRLVYRWIADGFVRERRGMTLEEVAEEYFYDLINRNLILPSIVKVDGTIWSCRVHDIMRELLVAKSIEENLVYITGEQEYMTMVDNIRQLIITSSDDITGANFHNIRSISVFDEHVPSILSSPSKLPKLVRVLDLRNMAASEKSNYKNLKRTIRHLGQFEHLRYISIPEHNYGGLPNSLGNIRDLQTLDIRRASMAKVPNNITKLHKLRHLLGLEVAIPRGIGKLKELQVLKGVDLKRSHPGVVEELTQLRQLRKLGVRNLEKEQCKKFFVSINELSSLRSLHIGITERDTVIADFQDIVLSPPEHLRSIRLDGWIGNLSAWISFPFSLVKVALYNTKLGDDAIGVLEDLPKLLYLRLWNGSYDGAKLTFRGAKFPKLKRLDAAGLENLQEFLFQEGTLPEFQHLWIGNCKLMSGISGIDHLARLRILGLGWGVYMANLDVVRKQLTEHPNRPTLEVFHPEFQELYEGIGFGGPPADGDNSSISDTEEMEYS
ncbi:hypothetical protein LUZ62_046296 [Rhynchospora pubera]|uniref:Uncharacterized protein n=1 Tax=Rhynchospora pubera TaxID=906938 RepID=A0AAV8FNF5_9POAL|nr:hypothetical protein LUZ62_046296 [Rhynchospora pubera]